MSQNVTKTIPDAAGNPIVDADGNRIEVSVSDKPIIIRGGSLHLDTDNDLVDEIDDHRSRHLHHADPDGHIFRIEIKEAGVQRPAIDIAHPVTIIIHYQ